MSGNYGWGGRDRSADFDYTPPRDDGFSRAYTPYQGGYNPPADPTPPRSRGKSVRMTGTLDNRDNVRSVMSEVAGKANVDLSPAKRQKTTAKNVVIVGADVTGSMGNWRDEMFKRLALFFKETQSFLGDDLEFIFIGIDDVPLGGSLEVTPIGRGQILDTYLAAMQQEGGGGGNAVESSELAAFYVHEMLDTSSAQNVYFFIITDEGFYKVLGGGDAATMSIFGTPASSQAGTQATEGKSSEQIFRDLKVRMNVYTILAEGTTGHDYSDEQLRGIKKRWRETLGAENVVPLDDARRIVDVMLGVMAKTTGQEEKFSRTLQSRQGGTQYGSENIETVNKSLAMVPGAPKAPPKAGTTSLLDLDNVTKL